MKLARTVEFSVGGVWGGEPTGGEDDVEVVRIADFDYARLSVRTEIPTVRSTTVQERRGRLLQTGDLLLEKSGGGLRTNVGRVVVWSGDKPAVCSNFIQLLRPAASHVPAYLAYLHRSLYRSGFAAANTKQTTGIQNLDVRAYLSTEVDVPEREKQAAIADFLDRSGGYISAVTSACGRTTRALAEQRGELFERLTLEAAVIPLRYRLDGIDQGWSPECDAQLADPGTWGVLKVGCVNYGRFRPLEHKRLPNDLAPRSEIEVYLGDVLMSRANTRELVGSAARVEDLAGRRLMLSDKIYRLRYGPKINPDFLVLALQSRACRDQIEIATAGASSSMQNISQDVIRSLMIPNLPLSRQAQIVDDVYVQQASIDKAVEKLNELRTRLAEYGDAVITEAVTGRLDATKVSEAQMDERLHAVAEGAGRTGTLTPPTR